MQRMNEIAKLADQRKELDARLKRYQEDLDWMTEMNNQVPDNDTEIEKWSTKAQRKIKEQYPQPRAKLVYSYTLEVTTEKVNDAGNLDHNTYDHTYHVKTSSGAKAIANNIQSHLEDYMKKPYIKSLNLKNVEIMDVPYDSLDLSLQPMFQASPLIIYDHMKLNCNFREVDSCVPSTLHERYAWQEKDGRTSKKLKIDMLDILDALNPDHTPEYVEMNEAFLMTKGYHAQDVLNLCQEYRIKMLALDHMDRVVLKHNENCNHNLPSLAFVTANNHMYLLDDDKVRKSIFATSSTEKMSKRKR